MIGGLDNTCSYTEIVKITLFISFLNVSIGQNNKIITTDWLGFLMHLLLTCYFISFLQYLTLIGHVNLLM